MTWTNKVTWSEGLFLRPQLFQQQERYLESFAHRRAAPLTPFYWGFSHFRIDAESLTLGKLVLASASGLCADGTPFDMPGQTPPPPPLTLLPEHLQQIIYLALPIRTPNAEETTFDAASGSLARFSVFETDLRDANSIGQGARTVQLSQLRMMLVPEKELTSAWMGLPLARVTSLRSDGSAELDPLLIPPVNRYGASEVLSQWMTQLHGNTHQRASQLAQRLTGSAGTGATQAAEVSDFLLLQLLNRFEVLLDHLLRVKETPPESAYNITQHAGRISITAKEEVVINGGGSYTIWNASGITSGTTGTHTVQAASHDFLPGKSLPVQALPETTPYNEMFVLRDKKGVPVPDFPYLLRLGSGRVVSGLTDSEGRTQRLGSGEAAAPARMQRDNLL